MPETIFQSLKRQYDTTRQLGSSVYQFTLNRKEISRLGSELMYENLSIESSERARVMAITGELESGSMFLGVPMRAA